ncbi:MAG TPA: TonB-dependent receptor [Tepidisphaeraceae bacterium]|jgi:outer membrane receptor protein involved in Fe transport|nr:TonB-dependent receptor [Tepidisphaeraceae bacterium]
MHFRNGLWAVAVLALGSAIGGIAHALPTTNPAATAGNSSTTSSISLPAPPPLPALPAPSSNSTTEPVAMPSPTTSPSRRMATTAPSQAIAPNRTGGQLAKVLVTSDLDLSRDQIAPSLGATTYTEGPNQIESIPEGDNATFQQVLLRDPGVVMDSFGQEHVRGEHANTTYRVDGVLLPQPINTFGQELDTHMIESVTLIDGSLPAQFGFHTAGIIDVTSKSGQALQGGEISLYGGGYDTYEPSVDLGWTDGKWDTFVAGSYKHSDDGIENPTPSVRPIHDDTDQEKLFVYSTYHIDDTSRLSFMVNGSNADFQIPNIPGVPPAFSIGSLSTFDSADLNENQNEQEYYGVVSYQKSVDQFSLLASAFYRYGQIHFTPDPVGDLLLQGVAGEILNSYSTSGLQMDGSYILNDQHTLRAGLIADYTVERNNTNTGVFAVDPGTGTVSTTPEFIVDDTRNDALEAGIYLQDEWKLTPDLTVNYGARLDEFAANFDNEAQLSPRVNLVWKVNNTTTTHIGYSRYFVPPPVQYVPPGTIAKFANTTNAPPNTRDDAPKVERSNYYDAGVSEQIAKPWQVNVDGFYKQAKNLVDLGQFGDAVIFTPFNYEYGLVYGAEISSTYKQGGFTAFGNFAWVLTSGKNIISQQFTIDSAELAYIQSNAIPLDHQSEYTASAGVSYQWTNDEVYLDFLYGSGLRSGFANDMSEPQYYPINIGYEHAFHPGGSRHEIIKLRFDVLNLLDESYQIRSGTGIGVGAPQYGQRRTFYMGLAYQF